MWCNHGNSVVRLTRLPVILTQRDCTHHHRLGRDHTSSHKDYSFTIIMVWFSDWDRTSHFRWWSNQPHTRILVVCLTLTGKAEKGLQQLNLKMLILAHGILVLRLYRIRCVVNLSIHFGLCAPLDYVLSDLCICACNIMHQAIYLGFRCQNVISQDQRGPPWGVHLKVWWSHTSSKLS